MVLYKLKQAEEIQKMIESPKIRPKGFQITRDHTYSYFRIATKKSGQPHAKFGVFFFWKPQKASIESLADVVII